MNFNLTVKALRNLRIKLDISQKTVADSINVTQTMFSCYERELYKMPQEVHANYERFLFNVLNNEKVVQHQNKREQVLSISETQNKELKRCHILIKEYEALLDMYRKERERA